MIVDMIVERLRTMDAKLDRALDEMGELKFRMTGIESGLAVINRRLDRIDNRLGGIERALDRREGAR